MYGNTLESPQANHHSPKKVLEYLSLLVRWRSSARVNKLIAKFLSILCGHWTTIPPPQADQYYALRSDNVTWSGHDPVVIRRVGRKKIMKERSMHHIGERGQELFSFNDLLQFYWGSLRTRVSWSRIRGHPTASFILVGPPTGRRSCSNCINGFFVGSVVTSLNLHLVGIWLANGKVTVTEIATISSRGEEPTNDFRFRHSTVFFFPYLGGHKVLF